MSIVYGSGGADELAQDMNCIGDVGPSDGKIDQAPNKMTIASRIRQWNPVIRTQLQVKLHGSVHCAGVRESSPSQQIRSVTLLRKLKTSGRRSNLETQKVAQLAKISHLKLLLKVMLDEGHMKKIITSNNHIIHIKQ